MEPLTEELVSYNRPFIRIVKSVLSYMWPVLKTLVLYY